MEIQQALFLLLLLVYCVSSSSSYFSSIQQVQNITLYTTNQPSEPFISYQFSEATGDLYVLSTYGLQLNLTKIGLQSSPPSFSIISSSSTPLLRNELIVGFFLTMKGGYLLQAMGKVPWSNSLAQIVEFDLETLALSSPAINGLPAPQIYGGILNNDETLIFNAVTNTLVYRLQL
jgi:hypothetical protein